MNRFLLLLTFLAFPILLFATHNRAGEIIVSYNGDCADGGTSACATIITYTERGSMADRDSLPIDWGDGNIEMVARTQTSIVDGAIQRNEYRQCHNYTGPGTYFIATEDPNRIAGILNVNYPNSIQVPFSIYTVYTLTNPAIFGCNSSPVLQQPPLDRACVGEKWTHNPGAFDPDGDSLSFEFAVPLVARGIPVPNYRPVNEVDGLGTLDIDSRTGQIEWDSPNLAGQYNLAFLVISYRNGFPLDTMIRDMQILVEDCINAPPVIEKDVEEICVVAGELISFDVTATAPLSDQEQLVSLRAAGGPFIVASSPAAFLPANLTEFGQDPIRRTFRWQTNCEHISDQPYFVVFRAEDNFFADTAGLSTIQTVAIKVIAPPPQNLAAAEEIGSVTLSWDFPYACASAQAVEFTGFSIWRRIGSASFVIDSCETGLEGQGYTIITDEPVQEFDNDRYIFIDDDVERGQTYCYRITANFVRRSPLSGLIFERLESLASEEVCAQLPRDVPLLTKVDVTATDTDNGQIDVCWTLPDPTALDTIINTGPYRYVLSRSIGINPSTEFNPIATFIGQNFSDAVDSCFTDTDINTTDNAYSYKVDLFVNNEDQPIDEVAPSSSVRLLAAPTDEAVNLSWNANVSWTNEAYDVFRKLPGATVYDSLTTVNSNTYRDTNLVNGADYCYFIRSVGSYGIPSLSSVLLNRSQEACVVPVDNVAPCAPLLSVSSVCDRGGDCNDSNNLYNGLSWTNQTDNNCNENDILAYRIYFAPNELEAPSLLETIDDPNLLFFDHFPDESLVGCYSVTAIDQSGNESLPSDKVCVSNCPFYELPNTFTPNGDNQNDLFIPRNACFIHHVDFVVFNRWGQKVFQTNDPHLNWDGSNLVGEALASGTYYYNCTVFEQRLEGIIERPVLLKGYIELIREN